MFSCAKGAVYQPSPPPIRTVKAGKMKKLSSKDSWNQRWVVLRTGGHLPPCVCVYGDESDAKKDNESLSGAKNVVSLLDAAFVKAEAKFKGKSPLIILVREAAKTTGWSFVCILFSLFLWFFVFSIIIFID